MIHPNIELTYEAAESHQMLFLDVWIDNTEGILKLNTLQKLQRGSLHKLLLYINYLLH